MGLSEAHNKGIYHRDFKASNVVITEQGVLKICDFGLAKDMNEDAHITGHTDLTLNVGTEGYIAPEILDGEIYDGKCDVWGLGIIVQLLCTKKKEFSKREREGARKYLNRIATEQHSRVSTVWYTQELKQLIDMIH